VRPNRLSLLKIKPKKKKKRKADKDDEDDEPLKVTVLNLHAISSKM